VPDYRAMIKSLRLAKNKVTVEVERGLVDEVNLRAKLYYKCEDRIYLFNEIPLEN